MDKYAIQDEDLVEGLRNEEHDLMLKVSNYMNILEKTGQEEADFRNAQSRLQRIRDKVTEYDLKKMGRNG